MKELVKLWGKYIDWLEYQILVGDRDKDNKNNGSFGDFMSWLRDKYESGILD